MDPDLERTYSNARSTSLKIGEFILRYGLAFMIGYGGLLKFTSYEAQGIQVFVANSPFMGWMYTVFTVQTTAIVIGLWEILAAILIALRSVSARASAVGSGMVVLMLLVTLTFLFTTPGVWQAGWGFPFMSPMPGQFLAKDLVLLGAAVWTMGEALRDLRVPSEAGARVGTDRPTRTTP